MLTGQEKKRLLLYLKDDHAAQDVTSAVLAPWKANAMIRANEPCILAGIEEATFLFKNQGLQTRALRKDGTSISKGPILEIRGDNRDILRVERTALNVLGRMSGVATLCRQAKKIAGKRTIIALTRKTVPGFNVFDKKAAKIAGIWPHRLHLEEAVLLKENHLVFFKSPQDAVRAAKKKGKTVEIEVENLTQALASAAEKPNLLMLDNFTLSDAKKAIPLIRKAFPGVKIELSGGIGEADLGKFASLKPDILSLGYLTKMAKTIDFSLDIEKA